MHYGGICINMISMKTSPEQGIARSLLWCCGFCTASSLVLLESIQQKDAAFAKRSRMHIKKKELLGLVMLCMAFISFPFLLQLYSSIIRDGSQCLFVKNIRVEGLL